MNKLPSKESLKQWLWGTKNRRCATILLSLLVIFLLFRHPAVSPIKITSSAPMMLSSDDFSVVKKEDFLVQVPVSGELYPFNQTTIVAKVSGEAQKVYVREGEKVKKNQLLAQLDIADLKEAFKEKRAALQSAEASYKLSASNIARYKKLLAQHFYSQNDYDAAVSQLAISQANIRQTEAALKEASLQMQYASIKASLDGIISERNLDPGMNVSVGQVLFKIINIDHLEWRAVVPADKVSRVKVHQRAIFQVEGMNDIFSGEIVRINPSNIAGTRAYYAYIDVDNVSQRLRNGLFATGNIILDKIPQAMIIPLEAIHHDAHTQKDYVEIINAEKKIQRKVVQIGLTSKSNNKAQIISGLTPGDCVIISAIDIQEGQSVILP